MHQYIKFILLQSLFTCFGQSYRPSSGVKDCTYCNRNMSKRYCCLLASNHTAVSVSFTIEIYYDARSHERQNILYYKKANCSLVLTTYKYNKHHWGLLK